MCGENLVSVGGGSLGRVDRGGTDWAWLGQVRQLKESLLTSQVRRQAFLISRTNENVLAITSTTGWKFDGLNFVGARAGRAVGTSK